MSLRALVVDDSKTARIALKRSLGALGMTIEFAESGEGAVDFLAHTEQLPHVVFMDMMMPGMGGLKATKAITDNPKTRHIRVIMCSSNESDADRKASEQHGAIALISKPPVKQQLDEVLSGVKAEVAPEPETQAAQPEVAPVITPPTAEPAPMSEPAPVAEKQAPPSPAEVPATDSAITDPPPMLEPVAKSQKPVADNLGLTPQVENLVSQLTEQFVKEIAKTTANDVARTTAMSVASSTAKEITNNTAKKTLPPLVEQLAKDVVQGQLQGLPKQVQKWVDQRINQTLTSESSKRAILDALKPEIHKIIDDANAIAEDSAYAAAQEAVKKGIAPLKWGIALLTVMLLGSIVAQIF